MKQPRIVIRLVLASLLALPVTLLADTVKGRIDYISKKAKTIQVTPKGKPAALVRFDDKTQFVNAGSIKDLGTKDLIEAEYAPGQPATKITKVVFDLPPGVEVDIAYVTELMKKEDCFTPTELEITADDVEKFMQRPEGCMIVDARPAPRYVEGHIPRAVSIYARELPDKIDLLPKDKSKLIIFYCGGPTCPFTGQSIKVAMEKGYTNVKGFQAGMPAWKKSGKPVHATASWLAKNLDEHHVVIDVRAKDESSKSHIKSAVAIPAAEFKAMTQGFIKEKKKAVLPGVSDTRAPIILYSDTDTAEEVLAAFAELKKWKYKNVAILEGGLNDWVKKGRPMATGPAATEIVYTRKLKEGAIPPQDFVKLEKSRDNVVLVDVRSPKETATGTLKGEGAVAIPLDELEANLATLPKDKKVIAYCSNGIRSEMAYELLKSKGLSNVAFLNETVVIKSDGSFTIE